MKEIYNSFINNSNDDLLEQGKLYYNDDNYEEAVKCFNKVKELNPNSEYFYK
ncbi:tetratricopeptide repeat protein [uncultured Brachyspira sp.]|uniref:tetratricopeptide repeat protein n=1 Tax=uncultured Brachyspira sp. TaxID=221953 RepID=UPI00262738F5|nr:tetratricopeptide repeat protein [uncultured Brachyspira sp.]